MGRVERVDCRASVGLSTWDLPWAQMGNVSHKMGTSGPGNSGMRKALQQAGARWGSTRTKGGKENLHNTKPGCAGGVGGAGYG